MGRRGLRYPLVHYCVGAHRDLGEGELHPHDLEGRLLRRARLAFRRVRRLVESLFAAAVAVMSPENHSNRKVIF